MVRKDFLDSNFKSTDHKGMLSTSPWKTKTLYHFLKKHYRLYYRTVVNQLFLSSFNYTSKLDLCLVSITKEQSK